jgi:osmotically-inducible protein OsmY
MAEKGKMNMRRGGPWLLAGLVALGGCSRQDADRLARVGRKGMNKAEAAVGSLNNNLTHGWPGGVDGFADAGLDQRVAARLRWDRTLAALTIDVQARGKEIELKGKVQDLTQRRRAVELAETTAGVEKVTDLLQTEAP